MILLGTIEDVFTISSRGTVLIPVFSECLDPQLIFRVGDEIQVRDAGGMILGTQIRGIEFLSREQTHRRPMNIGILLPKDTDGTALRRGLEIWLVRDDGRND